MRKINMSGLRFGRLTVLCEDGRLNGEVSWKCKCDCGNIKIVRGSHLRKGSIMSCGCLLSDTLKERNTIHNMTNTKIYKIWMHLKGMKKKSGYRNIDSREEVEFEIKEMQLDEICDLFVGGYIE